MDPLTLNGVTRLEVAAQFVEYFLAPIRILARYGGPLPGREQFHVFRGRMLATDWGLLLMKGAFQMIVDE